MNTYDMANAVRNAKATLNSADDIATNIASVLDGRLKQVNSTYLLKRLKKELQNFNANTGSWK